MNNLNHLYKENRAEVSRVDMEFMLSWIVENPKVFAEKWRKFIDEHSANYSIECRPRFNYINLIATRKAAA